MLVASLFWKFAGTLRASHQGRLIQTRSAQGLLGLTSQVHDDFSNRNLPIAYDGVDADNVLWISWAILTNNSKKKERFSYIFLKCRQ